MYVANPFLTQSEDVFVRGLPFLSADGPDCFGAVFFRLYCLDLSLAPQPPVF